MNERIKLLADEAKKYCYETYQNPKSPKWMPYSQMYDKKFAELLIQECANLNFRGTGFVTSEGEDMVRSMIKQHFGVKE